MSAAGSAGYGQAISGLAFKSVQGNAPVTDEDFDIAASSDTNYRPLREAQMDPGLGDEEPLAARPREPAPAESL